MEEFPHVVIYSDGACEGNPGPGGWAAILRYEAYEKVLSGSDPATTNNRMELTAAIKALRALNVPARVDFYTDSEYLKRGISEWLPGWKARGWRRKGGPLANIDLWQDLDRAMQPHKIQWRWLRGHAGIPDNERVDRLARRAIQNVKSDETRG